MKARQLWQRHKMDFDSLQEILSTIRKNKLRTFLTAFGVFWGILMLILLLGAGKGLQNGAEKGFGSDDRTSIWVRSSRTALPYKGFPRNRTIEFTENDVAAIKREIKGVQYISAENRAGRWWQRSINVTHKNKSGSFGVYGVANDYFNIKKYLEYRGGRTLNALDSSEKRKIALIGTEVRDRLYEKGVDPIGTLINFHGIILQVVGVFNDPGEEGRRSERVYIPLSTFQKIFGKANKVGRITLTPMPGIDPFNFEDEVIDLLKARHSISPDDIKAISTFNLAEQTKKMSQVFTAINTFIWLVGIGTLMAGIVGISNIMIITVKDRTREIGVRKALGATPRSIVSMILTEAVLITSFAGYFGLVLGVALLEGANMLIVKAGGNISFFDRPEVDMKTAFTAIVVLVICGTLAGLVPALRASKILPVEAMREI